MNYATIALALIELALKVAPNVVNAVAELKKPGKDITLEDIAQLRDRIKPPDEYLGSKR